MICCEGARAAEAGGDAPVKIQTLSLLTGVYDGPVEGTSEGAKAGAVARAAS